MHLNILPPIILPKPSTHWIFTPLSITKLLLHKQLKANPLEHSHIREWLTYIGPGLKYVPLDLRHVRHVEQLQTESCRSGKSSWGRIAHMLTVCRAASALLAPLSNRRLLVLVRSHFRSLIKALAQNNTCSRTEKNTSDLMMFVKLGSLRVERNL